jgi:hypothetical protein
MLISSPPCGPCSPTHSSPVVGCSALRVAVAQAPDPRAGADAEGRVVARHAAVAVDAHDLAQRLREVLRGAAELSLAQRDEQRLVAPEHQP